MGACTCWCCVWVHVRAGVVCAGVHVVCVGVCVCVVCVSVVCVSFVCIGVVWGACVVWVCVFCVHGVCGCVRMGVHPHTQHTCMVCPLPNTHTHTGAQSHTTHTHHLLESLDCVVA